MRLTDAEWTVMEVLWSGPHFSLNDITVSVQQTKGWNRNTVHTYLTRMEAKGLVTIHRGEAHPYSAAVSRDECARQERSELLAKVYKGAAGDLIAAFIKESQMSANEVDRLKALLDGMEV